MKSQLLQQIDRFLWWCLIEVNMTVKLIVFGTSCWMNELTDNQILSANSPVVFSGVASPRGLTKSVWLESLAVVSGVGCATSVWFK